MPRSLVFWQYFFLVSFVFHQASNADAQCIVGYQDANFASASTSFCAGGGAFKNDAYSSFRVPRGMRVRVFEHGDGSGLARTYFSDVPYVGALYNDMISSMRWGPFQSDDFVMLVASDPQFSWGHCEDNGSSELCRRERAFFGNASQEQIGRTYNENLVNALNAVGGALGEHQLAGVIVNGDLTEFGAQGPDLNDYVSIYEHGLDMNVYLGLGNHDYANNVDDCGENRCAAEMIWYTARQVPTLNPLAFDYSETGVYYQFPSLRKRHEGSLGYAWDVGDVHFVQLHNYPTYARSFHGWNFGAARRDHFEIRASLAWLRQDLERNREKRVVLNLHDYGAVQNDAGFRAILNDFPVSVVFAGHWHGTYGEYAQQGPFADGRRVPVLLSGSAHFGTFLATRYVRGKLYVWVFQVDHFDGARLKVRTTQGLRNVGNLADELRVCASGCPNSYQYAYDLR